MTDACRTPATSFALLLLLLPLLAAAVADAFYGYTGKQRYDGWYNNLAHPDWGSIGKYFQSS